MIRTQLNKQIAGDMDITETKVKVHCSNMMKKIKAGSLVELCRLVDKLKLQPENLDQLSK
jgi:FixJ family two-component response regulator